MTAEFTAEETEQIHEFIREIASEGRNQASAAEWGSGSSDVDGAIDALVEFTETFGIDRIDVRDFAEDVAFEAAEAETSVFFGSRSRSERAQADLFNFITTGERPK